MSSYYMLKIGKFPVFTVSNLYRDNQQGGERVNVPPPFPKLWLHLIFRLNIWSYFIKNPWELISIYIPL